MNFSCHERLTHGKYLLLQYQMTHIVVLSRKNLIYYDIQFLGGGGTSDFKGRIKGFFWV